MLESIRSNKTAKLKKVWNLYKIADTFYSFKVRIN